MESQGAEKSKLPKVGIKPGHLTYDVMFIIAKIWF